MNDEEANYDRLVGLLYEVSLDQGRWDEPLIELAKWIGSSGFHFLGWDKERNVSPFATISESWTPFFIGYHTHYGMIDPHIHAGFNNAAGTWLVSHQCFDQHFVDRNEFYQDYLIPGGERYLMGSSLIRTNELDVVLAFGRSLGVDPFSDEDIARVRRITPHLQRAVKLHMQTTDLRQSIAAGERGLDAMRIGVLALDGTSQIVYANTIAEALLRTGSCLKTSFGKLNAARFANNQRLHTAVQNVTCSGIPHTLQAVSVRDGDSDVCHLTIIPLTPNSSISLSLSKAKVLVLVRSMKNKSGPNVQQLMQLFGLTQAEGRLSEALATGLDLEQYALMANVGMPTVRTQLSAVFRKTGTNRQSALVQLLARMPVTSMGSTV